MNKKVLIWFILVVGIVLGGIPIVGQIANRQGVVEASSNTETVEFAWNETTLVGTGWNYVYEVPLMQKHINLGMVDVDMVVEFLPENRIKLTTHVFSQGPISPYAASVIEKLTSTQEASFEIMANTAIKTTLKNPLRELNDDIYQRELNLRLIDGKLHFEGGKLQRAYQYHEAKRFF
jgi:hypothetical protein